MIAVRDYSIGISGTESSLKALKFEKTRNNRNIQHFRVFLYLDQNSIPPIKNRSLGNFKRFWSPDIFSQKHVFRPK